MKTLSWIIALVAISTLTVSAQEPQSKCKPVAFRNGEGCWILTSVPIGELPNRPLYWHLDVYPTREAAEKAKGEHAAVVESLDKVWLLTLAEREWRARRKGKHVATIGPLPVEQGKEFTAQYMEAVMAPGWQTPMHTHPGPEVWYTEQGETCLETPRGKQVGKKGVPVIVPAGEPMRLTVTGKAQRRSLVLVLHDSSQPWNTMIHDWTPKNLCK